MKELLLDLSLLTGLQNGVLSPQRQALAREEYEAIIARGLEETGGAVLKKAARSERRKRKDGEVQTRKSA
jgi:hypothetical protein